MARALDIDERWEFKLATRLSRIGVALLGQESATGAQASTATWAWESEVGQHLVKLIPRLRMVSDIIGKWGTANGVFPTVITTDEESVTASASIIHAAWHLEQLFKNGLEPQAAAAELHKLMPQACERLLEAVKRLTPPAKADGSGDNMQEVSLAQLKEGMVLAAPFEASGLKLAAGHRISQAMILRLSYLQKTAPEMKLQIQGSNK